MRRKSITSKFFQSDEASSFLVINVIYPDVLTTRICMISISPVPTFKDTEIRSFSSDMSDRTSESENNYAKTM